MASRVIWQTQMIRGEVDRIVMRNLTRAAMFVVNAVVLSISIGQPPSLPGQPPHVLYGGLRRSVTYKVFRLGNQIIALVGSNMKYARRLELGFIGVDKLGRRYNQAPRPYLRPAARNNRSEIMRLVTGS